MSRIVLKLPEHFNFKTTLEVRIYDVNYGNHLGNNAVLSLIHEARLRFLTHFGFSEQDIGGCGLVVSDVAIIYKAQAFWQDSILIEVAVADFNKYGCDFYFKLTNNNSKKVLAHAKTGIIAFDYQLKKMLLLPEVFRKTIEKGV
jgi:acyl-CoA thioesterase FadM